MWMFRVTVASMKRPYDLSGRKFGRLTAVSMAQHRRRGRVLWVCRCVCGGTRIAGAGDLCGGRTQSCGCLVRETIVKHGGSSTPEYKTWHGMRRRCYSPNQTGYELYGGRGIKVCARWRASFQHFLDDMGPRPSPRHSIDRIDVNGDYEPGNCRWATIIEQANNTRPRNGGVTWQGRTQSVAAWARELELPFEMLWNRLHTLRWPIERALSAPADARHRTFRGERLSLAALGRRFGISPDTIRARLRYGWTLERAVTTPTGPLGTNQFKGTTMAALARAAGLSKSALHQRLKAGWDLGTALSTPIDPRRRR